MYLLSIKNTYQARTARPFANNTSKKKLDLSARL
jgi:hypothetical protein